MSVPVNKDYGLSERHLNETNSTTSLQTHNKPSNKSKRLQVLRQKSWKHKFNLDMLKIVTREREQHSSESVYKLSARYSMPEGYWETYCHSTRPAEQTYLLLPLGFGICRHPENRILSSISPPGGKRPPLLPLNMGFQYWIVNSDSHLLNAKCFAKDQGHKL